MKRKFIDEDKVIKFIKKSIKRRGIPPTVRETAKFFGISKTTAGNYLKELCRDGFLKFRYSKKKRVARGIKIKNKDFIVMAKTTFPGGVNSPVRAFKNVKMDLNVFKNAKNCKLYDVYGRSFIDFTMGWGSLILGHSNERILNKVKKVMQDGFSLGYTNTYEIELGNEIK